MYYPPISNGVAVNEKTKKMEKKTKEKVCEHPGCGVDLIRQYPEHGHLMKRCLEHSWEEAKKRTKLTYHGLPKNAKTIH